MKWIVVMLMPILMAGIACSKHQPEPKAAKKVGSIMKSDFGTLPDGRKGDLYTIKNENGMEMRVTNYGGIIVSLKVPDRSGRFDDVVLGYDKLADYLAGSPYFGAIIGRYGNRIAGGKFTLNGREYTLATNNGANHLHGGVTGFDKVLWDAQPFQNENGVGLVLSYLSRDGEEGYPGNLTVNVTYTLDNNNHLQVNYQATTDQPTICNLTQHTYFNLGGHNSGTINHHELMINASRFTPVDGGLIPTGELRPVEGTPFDFRKPTPIGARLDADDPQLKYGLGYDHNWVLDRQTKNELELAATLYEPGSGRYMEVWTTEPGIQFYGGNFLDGSNIGKGGHAYQHRTGLCLETQHFPDSPNKPDFPPVTLNPDEVYHTTTIYKFATKQKGDAHWN